MASRSPTEHHSYWGSFGATTDLPNVAAAPVQDGALEAGDQAYVPGVGLLVCSNPALGAAVWDPAGGGGGTWQLGELLWEWNGVDVSQFEPTAVGVIRSSGAPASNAPAALGLSVVPAPGSGRLGNMLRLTATSLESGGVFGVLASELTLPESYVIYVSRMGDSGGGIWGLLFPFYNPGGAGAFDGAALFRSSGSTGATCYGFVDDVQVGNETMTGAGAPDAIAAERGGVQQVVTCNRPTGSTPATALVTIEDRNPNGQDVRFEGALPADMAGISPNWDGISMGRFGIGALNNNLAGATATIDFGDLKVYAASS